MVKIKYKVDYSFAVAWSRDEDTQKLQQTPRRQRSLSIRPRDDRDGSKAR